VKVIKDNLFPIPPLFNIIKEQSGASWDEMFRVFNMGHRMELYAPEAIAADIITTSQSFGVEAQIIGRVEASDKTEVLIKHPLGEVIYSK
jgi:phosphoribosylformylglycinamidine cyclo-ligase